VLEMAIDIHIFLVFYNDVKTLNFQLRS